MNPIIIGALGTVLDRVIDKLTNNIPVTETEKENLRQEAQKELASQAGELALAEAKIAEQNKDVWLSELATPNSLAALWRPIVALGSFGILLWDGILSNLLNSTLVNLGYIVVPSVPPGTVEAVSYVLLTLVGARSLDKFFVSRKVR
jgi:hypothetical protein